MYDESSDEESSPEGECGDCSDEEPELTEKGGEGGSDAAPMKVGQRTPRQR